MAAYPRHCEPHLSDEEATRIVHEEVKPALQAFVVALNMTHRITLDRVALLIEQIVKEQRVSAPDLIADLMRLDQWQHALSEGENLPLLAERISLFFHTEQGIALYNFYVKIFAKTTDTPFE